MAENSGNFRLYTPAAFTSPRRDHYRGGAALLQRDSGLKLRVVQLRGHLDGHEHCHPSPCILPTCRIRGGIVQWGRSRF